MGNSKNKDLKKDLNKKLQQVAGGTIDGEGKFSKTFQVPPEKRIKPQSGGDGRTFCPGPRPTTPYETSSKGYWSNFYANGGR